MKVRHAFLVMIISILTMTAGITSQAQTGNLDPTFGTGGIVRTDFAGSEAVTPERPLFPRGHRAGGSKVSNVCYLHSYGKIGRAAKTPSPSLPHLAAAA